MDIGEAALEGVRGGLVPGAPQAGVVAEPLPRKLPGIIQELFICVIEELFPPTSRTRLRRAEHGAACEARPAGAAGRGGGAAAGPAEAAGTWSGIIVPTD